MKEDKTMAFKITANEKEFILKKRALAARKTPSNVIKDMQKVIKEQQQLVKEVKREVRKGEADDEELEMVKDDLKIYKKILQALQKGDYKGFEKLIDGLDSQPRDDLPDSVMEYYSPGI